MKPGTTTRDEVRRRLGQPNIVDGKRISVYEWRTARGYGIVGIAGVPAVAGGGLTGSNQSRLLVEFDEAGKVRHFAFTEYRYPGLYFKEPPGGYFVDGSARELPRPTAALLKPNRALTGRDSRRPGEWLWHPIHSQSAALAISRDGRYVAAAPVMGNIEVWDLSSGGKRTFASGFKGSSANSIDISRDGKILAAADFDDATVLWDMASAERLHVLRGHGKSTLFVPAGPATVQFAPDGRTVATGGRDGVVKLWDVASGKETSSFPIRGGTVQSLAFAPRGDLLAAGTLHGDVVVVDVAAGKQARILAGSDEFEPGWRGAEEEPVLAGRNVAFSSSGETLAANDCVAVELWRVSDIRGQIEPRAEGGEARTADSQHDPAVVLLLPYGKRPGCPRRERTLVAFSPGDELLIASSNLYSVWDLRSRRLLAAWDPANALLEPVDLTLGPGRALLAWNHSEGRSIQVMDLAPIIRESMEGGQRAGAQGGTK